MNQDQRLIPFLGGLVLGGVGGAAFDNKFQGYNYYPPYSNVYNQYPTYYQTQPLQYYQQYYPYNLYNQYQPQQTNTLTKMIDEQPSNIMYSQYERGIIDLSFVPIYKEK